MPAVLTSFFLEAEPSSGDTVGIPVDLPIIPDTAQAADFGVANVNLSTFSAEIGSLVQVNLSGFIPGDNPRIFFGGDEFCHANFDDCSPGATPLSATQVFDSTGKLDLPIKVPSGINGVYSVTAEDESGRIGFALFTVIDASDDFDLTVSPVFIDSIEQDTDSTPISIKTSAIPGKNPETINLKIFGLPPGILTTIGGSSVSFTDRVGPGIDIPLGIGESKTTSLIISPTSSVLPDLYFMSVEAESAESFHISEIPVAILPGGNIDLGEIQKLVLSTTNGKPGDVVNLQTSGFIPNAPMSLRLQGIEIASSSSFNPIGEFSTSFKIPDSAEIGIYPLKISDGTNEVTQDFEIESSFTLSVSPGLLNSVIPGQTSDEVQIKIKSPIGVDADEAAIQVIGAPPDSEIKFFKDNAEVLGAIMLDPPTGGEVSIGMRIETAPSTPPGSYGLIIEADDGTSISALPVTIGVLLDETGDVSTLTLGSLSISPGEDLTLSGSGYETGSSFSFVDIGIDGSPTSQSVSVGDTIVTDSNGEWNTLISIPDGLIQGEYVVSVTADERTASSMIDIIPEEDPFFDVDFTPDFLKVTKGIAIDSGQDISMIIKGSNGFGGTGDNLQFLVTDLPLGMTLELETSSGNEIVTYRGTLQGNTITKNSLNANLGTDDVLIGGTDIIPGKQTTINADFGTTDSTSVGTYVIFIGAEENIVGGDISGTSVLVEVSDSNTSFSITPNEGGVLGKRSFSGEGFNADTPISLKFGTIQVGDDSFATAPEEIVSDGSGKFSGYLIVPNLSAGSYTVSASDEILSASTSYQIKPNVEDTFTLNVSPKKILLESGSSSTQTVTVKSLGAFNSPITVSLDLPAELVSNPMSKVITPTPGVSSSVTFTIFGNIPGVYTYDVVASGAFDIQTASASTEIQPADDFTFSFGPDDIVVEAGGDPVVVRTKAITVTPLTFPSPIDVSTVVDPLIEDETSFVSSTIQIDPNDSLGDGTIVITATSDAVPGEYPITVSATDRDEGLTKNGGLTLIVVAGQTEEIENSGLDPSSISNAIPGVVLPEYSDGLNPQYKFTSLTTDALTNTAILTTKVNAPLTDISTKLADENGIPLGADAITSFGTQIYNIAIGAGVTELEVEVCLPVESLDENTVATSLFFFSVENTQWEKIPITRNDGILICGITDHLSSWAIGGVKALASGGSGGSAFAPSFGGKYFDGDDKYPLEINGISYDLPDFENTIQKQVAEIGEPLNFKFTIFENSGGEHVEHFEFLTNLTEKN